MKKLEVRFTRDAVDSFSVGTLAEDRGTIYFEYSPEFVGLGLNLSPFSLPFEPGLFEHKDREFGALPGLFDDSLPDGWGLLLMDRHFRSLGRSLADISPLDRLSWLGTSTMGALTYHPPAENDFTNPDLIDLHDMARQSREILEGSVSTVLPQLLKAGGSPGGARPKVLVGFNPGSDRLISGENDLPDGYDHWMVKFPGQADFVGVGALEYAYSLMARGAGIEMPPTRLFETSEGGRFFGAQRFDRSNNRRYHVHSFGNMIQSNFRIPSNDYADLLKVTSLLTRNHDEVLEAFRRMVFNLLAHNRDDHVKNFSFILDDETGDWRMSPAYDLLHTPGPGGEHTMTLLGEGRNPGISHLLGLAEQAGVSERVARGIIDEVKAAIDQWPEFADQAGVLPGKRDEVFVSLPRLD